MAEVSICQSEASSFAALLQTKQIGQRSHEDLQQFEEVEYSRSLGTQGLINSLKDENQKQHRCACESPVETSLNVCFERAADLYQKKYSDQGRILPGLPPNAISLDFELETGARLVMTPDLLLLRGGWDINQGGNDLFPSVSKWFSVGLDGVGRSQHGTYQQQVNAMVELSSVPMRPQDVSAGFLEDFESYLNSIDNITNTTLLPGTTDVFIKHSHSFRKPCSNCHLQWSVGLPLARVPALLALSDNHIIKLIMKRSENLCRQRPGGCIPEYRGLVLLAAWVLRAAHICNRCANPKRCMRPWLVRTHFGDLVKHVRHVHGENVFLTFVGDVFQLASLKNPDGPIFPHGFHDYLHFSEMAEFSGLIVARDSQEALTNVTGGGMCMPTGPKDLRLLADQMLQRRYMVNRHLHIRKCGVYGAHSQDLEDVKLTARDWLREMLEGRDIMSDHDSPVTKASFSKLVWKSMGSWRLDNDGAAGGDGEGRIMVFLECRSPMHCIKGTSATYGPLPKMRQIAKVMRDFEEDGLRNLS